MHMEKRELYSSPNGDRWFLSRDPATGRVFVRHEANLPSGGRVTDIDIGAFLGSGAHNPEQQALLRLIGTLIESVPMPESPRSAQLAERLAFYRFPLMLAGTARRPNRGAREPQHTMAARLLARGGSRRPAAFSGLCGHSDDAALCQGDGCCAAAPVRPTHRTGRLAAVVAGPGGGESSAAGLRPRAVTVTWLSCPVT